jgi:hypothetical protein
MTTAAEWLMSANTGSTGPTAAEIAAAILAAAQITPIHADVKAGQSSVSAAVWAHATRVITGPTANDNADALLARTWP